MCAEVDRLADQLLHASHEIHAHPELNFEEHFAHDLLVDQLRAAGLETTAARVRRRHRVRGVRRRAAASTSRSCASTTRLPGIGHACGHNVIATAGLGAGLAAAAVADAGRWHAADHGHPGRGGWRRQDRRWPGVARSKSVDAAMMVHPADADLDSMDTHRLAGAAGAVPRQGGARRSCAVGGAQRSRCRRARLHEHRRAAPAHPSDRTDPRRVHQGRRQGQHRSRRDRDGVDRSFDDNRVPATPQATRDDMPGERRNRMCVHRRSSVERPYLRRHDRQWTDGRRVRRQCGANWPNSRRPGIGGRRVVGSTDMGNVSYLVPSIHPDDQGCRRRGGDPHRRVRRVGTVSRRRQGGARWGQVDGHDDRRSVDLRRAPRWPLPQRSALARRPSRCSRRRSGGRAIRRPAGLNP